jgi:purine-nucleoside phosphorylase
MSGSSAFAELARAASALRPEAALVLGSGMAPLARRLHRIHSAPFIEVPGLSAPSIPGHAGCLTLGTWAGRRVLVFEGRLHYYEGHSWRSVTNAVQTAAFLGAPVLLLTNAAGGIHDALVPGSFMAVRDQIEWTRAYCWRETQRSSPYCPQLRKLLAQAAVHVGVKVQEGTYAAVTGPSYETQAEIRALRACGADAVGMSTAREAQEGFERGLKVAALSCITNRAAGLSAAPIDHAEVLTTAAAQADRLAALLDCFLPLLSS